MLQITTSTLTNQSLATILTCITYTADADREIFVRLFADQVAGNGVYTSYVTIQRLGAGSAYQVVPLTAPTVASGVTAIGFMSVPFPVKATDVVKVLLLGLAGDTTTPDIITEVWDAEPLAQYLGTAQAGGNNTITLSATNSPGTDNLVNGSVVRLIAGTGAGQARVILSYVSSTKVATVGRNWVTNPDSTSVYYIYGLSVPRVDDSLQVYANVTQWLGQAVQAAVNGFPKVDLTYVLGTILTEGATGRLAAAIIQFFNIASPTGTVNLTPTTTNVTNDVGITQAAADKVWGSTSRTLSAFGFTVSITLSAANVLQIWNQLTTDAGIVVNSFAKLIKDNLNATVSSRSTLAQSDILSDATPFAGASIAAIKAKTDQLLFSGAYVRSILMRWLTDDAAGTPNALSSGNVPVGTVTVGNVTLAASQPLYAPAKAGDEMNLEDDAITAAKVATGVIVGTSPTAGEFTVNITVTDVDTSDPIPNVFVIIKGSNDVTPIDQNTTDENGIAQFAINAGSFKVHLALPPAYESAVEDLTISTNTNVSYALTPIVIGAPTSPNLCRVYGYEYQDGNAVVNRTLYSQLTRLPQTTSSAMVVLEGVRQSTVTDTNGFWYFDLVRGKTYQIQNSLAAGVDLNILIPDASSINFATFIPADD